MKLFCIIIYIVYACVCTIPASTLLDVGDGLLSSLEMLISVICCVTGREAAADTRLRKQHSISIRGLPLPTDLRHKRNHMHRCWQRLKAPDHNMRLLSV